MKIKGRINLAETGEMQGLIQFLIYQFNDCFFNQNSKD